jgi:hypothetical protein
LGLLEITLTTSIWGDAASELVMSKPTAAIICTTMIPASTCSYQNALHWNHDRQNFKLKVDTNYQPQFFCK